MINLTFIIIGLASFAYILNMVIKNKFSIEESIFWTIGSIIILVLSIFPKLIDKLATILKVDYPPSLFFLICIIFLLFINFRNSRKINEQQLKIIELAQQVALLKQK